MKIKLLSLIGLIGLMTATLVAPEAAHAAIITPTVSANIDHSVIHSGAYATIYGAVSPNARYQHVYLQRAWSGQWHTVHSRSLTYYSRYAFKVAPTTRGTYSYRVYRPAQTGRSSAASRVVKLTVQTWGWATWRSYSGLGDWQGATVWLPARDYKLEYSFQCQSNFLPFWVYSWMAQGDGYESAWIEPASGGYGRSGTWYGHGGAQYGYFDIGTQSDCHWSFTISTAGWR